MPEGTLCDKCDDTFIEKGSEAEAQIKHICPECFQKFCDLEAMVLEKPTSAKTKPRPKRKKNQGLVGNIVASLRRL